MSEKIQLGKTQELIVVKTTDFGVYLNTPGGEDTDKILLPKAQVPKGTQLKDALTVFVYCDSEDRPIATMEEPELELGGVARLKVKEVTKIGAFLEMGLSKDLLLPFKQQLYKVEPGDAVLVTMYLDDKYSALIPKKEVFEKYRINQPVYARVSQVLEDGRLSLSVKKKIPEQMEEDAEFILHRLEDADGFLPYHDKSAPEEIKAHFHMSKNAFKRAIGRLMKEGYITIGDDGIRMK